MNSNIVNLYNILLYSKSDVNQKNNSIIIKTTFANNHKYFFTNYYSINKKLGKIIYITNKIDKI
jgi:hypothetical protein